MRCWKIDADSEIKRRRIWFALVFVSYPPTSITLSNFFLSQRPISSFTSFGTIFALSIIFWHPRALTHKWRAIQPLKVRSLFFLEPAKSNLFRMLNGGFGTFLSWSSHFQVSFWKYLRFDTLMTLFPRFTIYGLSISLFGTPPFGDGYSRLRTILWDYDTNDWQVGETSGPRQWTTCIRRWLINIQRPWPIY